MTDLQISKALALAIGWRKDQMIPSADNPDTKQCWVRLGYAWKKFDYRDPTVIWPIAAKFDCFPVMNTKDQWFSMATCGAGNYADTPERAVAMAVINKGKS